MFLQIHKTDGSVEALPVGQIDLETVDKLYGSSPEIDYVEIWEGGEKIGCVTAQPAPEAKEYWARQEEEKRFI